MTSLGKPAAKQTIHALLDRLGICPVDETVIRNALNLSWPDLEDAILYESARAAGLDTIITRDAKGFSKSALLVLAPSEVIAQRKNHA